MKDCPSYQQIIVEEVSLSGRAPKDWQEPTVAQHLLTCLECQAVLDEEVALCQLLEEPLPLPPADLIPSVMAKICAELEETAPKTAPLVAADPGLSWAERFAWAASGAVAMFAVERLPNANLDWLPEAQTWLFSHLSTLAAPLEINTLYLAVMALGLFVAQGVMVYQVKGSAQ